PAQYPRLPYAPYAATSRLGWVCGRSLVSGQPVHLPALAAFLGYQAQTPEEDLFPVTSNGMAAGTSLAQALLAALYEVLERDAFMITWLGRLPTRRVDPATHPDPALRALCSAYRRRGVELGLWRLPTDHPGTVFLALGVQVAGPPGPAVIAGAGADLDPARAAHKALLEVGQIRPSYCRSLRRPAVQARLAALVADPQRVATMHDHGLLYCSPARRPALAFLLDRIPEPLDWRTEPSGAAGAQLAQLVSYFRARGQEVLYYNLTPPDLARQGLAVVRVILPGFQPIAFGAQEARLGGRRLYDLPQQLGLAPARLTLPDLNPDPHPFD
ncbi:MAG TPA: YcaO-like family protein, partial [Chloroflexia bacterium]|nr:YcaO-like family protein [Chloroflexia bacterium]